MKKELEAKLVERWPKWFTRMHFDFACGNGWFPLLWKLCEYIEENHPGDHFEVVQVKEKFGGLRFYVEGAHEGINRLIGAAEEESYKTCEYCGQPGKARGGGWIKTLCDECEIKRHRKVTNDIVQVSK